MAAIPENWTLDQLLPGNSTGVWLGKAMRDVADDLAELRTTVIDLLTKIDADSGDTGGDSDYVSTLTPAALKTTKA